VPALSLLFARLFLFIPDSLFRDKSLIKNAVKRDIEAILREQD
jgi:hypothetical protein